MATVDQVQTVPCPNCAAPAGERCTQPTDTGRRPVAWVHLAREAAHERWERLEYLRGEIRAERISYGELAELESLVPYIEAGDTELLQWAGVPEGRDA